MKKVEGYATATDRYKTLEGALYCMIEDCNIEGISSRSDQDSLF